MRLLSFAAAAALAACVHQAPVTGHFDAVPMFAALFKPYQLFVYHVATGAAPEPDDDTATSVVVRCRVDEVKPFPGGVTSHVKCNLPESIANDTGTFPLEGIWMANDSGVWHVHSGATPSLDNATLILPARPEAGNVAPEQLTADDTFEEIARDGDGWCATHKVQLDVETSSTLCFALGGVRSGKYGYKQGTMHETRFELAR